MESTKDGPAIYFKKGLTYEDVLNLLKAEDESRSEYSIRVLEFCMSRRDVQTF